MTDLFGLVISYVCAHAFSLLLPLALAAHPFTIFTSPSHSQGPHLTFTVSIPFIYTQYHEKEDRKD